MPKNNAQNAPRSQWEHLLSSASRTAFFACVVTGLLVHLYAFTNLIPNSDGIGRMFDLQQMTISGRWFLHFSSALNAFTQMPAAIGLLSLLFLGLSAAMSTDLLAIKRPVLAGAGGAMMAAFPCVGYLFLYMFTASSYCLSILLATLSVWLARRGGICIFAGAAVLALSMGIYQAYATVAIALSILLVLRQIFDETATVHAVFHLGLRLVGTLLGGAILYYVILLCFLHIKNLSLLSYLGMDAASAGYPFAALPALVVASYRQVVAFFFVAGSANAFTNKFFVIINILILLTGVGTVYSILKHKKCLAQSWRLLGAGAMVVLLPLGINFAQIISPFAPPTPIMKYAFVYVYLCFLMVLDMSPSSVQTGKMLPVCALCGALGLFCLNTNNLLYTAADQAHRATESYITRLLMRMESCADYSPTMPVAIIGAIPPEQLRTQLDSLAQVEHYSVPQGTALPLNKHIYYYLKDWLNVPIEMPDEDTMLEVSQTAAFRAMPLYPQEGSVQVIDGILVVKLQAQYTPKSDFELAYENRR